MHKNIFITLTISTLMLSTPTTSELQEIDATRQIHSSASHSLSSPNSTNASSAGRLIINTKPSLEELCVILNVPLDACSCKMTPDLCGFESFLTTIKNETDAPPIYRRSNIYTTTYVAVTIIASTFGLLGNALVLLVALTRRHSLSSCKLYIAFVSFVVSIVQIVNAVPLLLTNEWIHSATTCKSIRTILELGSFLIIGFIVIIAIERFILVNRGIDTGFTYNLSKHILVTLDILFVIITVIPYTIGLNIESDSGRCIQFEGPYKKMSLPYNWFVLVFHSIIPLCIISILYTRIIKHISKHANTIDKANNYLLHANKVKMNKKCENVMLTILFFFVISTLPIRIINIYMDMKHLHHSHQQQDGYWFMEMDAYLVLVFIGYVTYPFQSIINPVLYSMIDTEWRKDMMEMMRKFTHSI